MTEKIQQKIFSQLVKIGIIDETGTMKAEYMKFSSEGLMDLHVDRLPNNMLSLAHNGKLNGDVMADPDVEIAIFPQIQCAEGFTFQNDYLGIYQEVYTDGKPNVKLRTDLNIFLHEWLSNIIDAKYELAETED